MSSSDALAQLWVDSELGLLSWTNRISADSPTLTTLSDRIANFIDPGQYVCRLTQLTGDAIGGSALATWIDCTENPIWFVTTGTIGEVLAATATLEVAEDDGAGNPSAGTTVIKPVQFRAEFLGDTGVLISTIPWALSHIVEEETAAVTLVTKPDGNLEVRKQTKQNIWFARF